MKWATEIVGWVSDKHGVLCPDCANMFINPDEIKLTAKQSLQKDFRNSDARPLFDCDEVGPQWCEDCNKELNVELDRDDDDYMENLKRREAENVERRQISA